MSNKDRRFNIEGADIGYPTHFHKGLSGLGIFSVSSRAANALIANSGFRVAEIAPGKAAFSLACVHYTDTDCGAYEEIALSFFVRKLEKRRRVPYVSTWRDVLHGNIASYAYRLPVSTKASVDCGVLMWGFPKTVDDLTYEDEGSHARFTWKLDGKNILSYRIKSEGNKQPDAISPPVYSVYEGARHVSYLTQNYRDVGYFGRSGGELTLGEHAISNELRGLGISRKPLFATYNGDFDFVMSAPEKL